MADLPVNPDAIRIATFNIQVFGQSKLDKPQVVSVLARAIQQFDVIAVQEIRSAEQDVLPRFLKIVNRSGRRYDFLISERLGRTVSKEQYAFIFDTERVQPVPGWVFTVQDPTDRLHRPPFVSRFRTVGTASDEAFTFTLVNIHTDPDEAKSELNALDDVFLAVEQDGSGEDDIILLCDFNVDDKHLGELGRIPGIEWVISGIPTNTRQSEQYDNILFRKETTTEFTGRYGVYNLESTLGMSLNDALEVSDHLPIWAEFSIREARTPGVMAGRPGTRF